MMAETSSLLRRKKSTYVNSVITEHSNSKSLTSFMSSQDSGYIESQQTPSRNTEDTRSKAKGIGAAYLPVYPDTSPDLALSGSPAECGEGSCSSGEILDRKVSVFPSLLYETPKLIRKDAPFRRRLLLSSVCSNGSVEDVNTPDNLTHKSVRQWTTHEISNFEGRNCLYSFADSPGNENFDVIATSTLKTEEPVNSCNKWRLAFAQNRTSTIDESKCKGTALTEEVKFETPTQNSELESCSDPENPYLEIFRTPTSGSKTRSLESNFLTPVSSLAADLNFSSISTPPVTPVATLNVSTTEDSGFNSLGLDGSLDSYSDHEGSFQELACSYKETPKSLDSKRRQRKLERVKRLSTLRERGSQSETEEDGNRTLINDLEVKLRIKKDSITECDEPVFTEKVSDEPILKVGDLSRTPALQIIHDICLRSQKGHPQQHTLHSVLEYESRTKSCERVMQLAGLIGRKMGLEKLDIMLELKIRNLKHVISEILNTLSIEDICSFCKVSKIWREIIYQDKNTFQKRKLYLKQLKASSEQCHLTQVEDAATRLNLLTRSALSSVQPQSKVTLTHAASTTPVSSSEKCGSARRSSSRHEQHLKIAQSLFNDEALKQCPRCQSPAKYQSMTKRAVCTRESCCFDFCTQCLCVFHGSKECSNGSAKRRNRNEALPGSAQSKRNLKRL